jgi:hypothetical protein
LPGKEAETKMSNKVGFPHQRPTPMRRSYRLSRSGLRSLRAKIRRSQPWKKSTGPRTKGGKARSALNALRHGAHSAAAIELQRRARTTIRELAAIRLRDNDAEDEQGKLASWE